MKDKSCKLSKTKLQDHCQMIALFLTRIINTFFCQVGLAQFSAILNFGKQHLDLGRKEALFLKKRVNFKIKKRFHETLRNEA